MIHDNTEGGALAIIEQGEFEWGIVSTTGCVLKPETPEEEWHKITSRWAQRFEDSGKSHAQAAMVMGDLLHFGDEHFHDTYGDVIDATRAYIRVQTKTLMNWSWIAGKIHPSRRRENLTLAHHEAVAKLESDEQEEFLQLAEDEGMNTKELKAAIKERHPGKPRTAKDSVTKLDNEKSALQKLIDVDNYLKAQGRDFALPAQWKGPSEGVYKAYRRCFMGSGHAKR